MGSFNEKCHKTLNVSFPSGVTVHRNQHGKLRDEGKTWAILLGYNKHPAGWLMDSTHDIKNKRNTATTIYVPTLEFVWDMVKH